MRLRSLPLALCLFVLAACNSMPQKASQAPAQAQAQAQASAEPAVMAASTAPQAESNAATATTDTATTSPYPAAKEDPSKRGDYVAGGLYAPHIKDSVPDVLPDVDRIPEPKVKAEKPSRYGNRTYSVLGKSYRILSSADGYVEQGMASFYGKKFHGRLTSNQEVYDMYAMTAAHKTLPLPSYVRVTNLENGKTVVVRVNDRGPFHSSRIIDLSYAAATKLGFVSKGVARVEVRALTPGDTRGKRGRRAEDGDAEELPNIAATPSRPALRADAFERALQAQGMHAANGTPDGSTAVAATQVAAVAGDAYTIQLASFATRDNAERAQSRLRTGGVEGVRIDEGVANGQSVWRLRIGPVSDARARELSVRLSALGFASPRIVRE